MTEILLHIGTHKTGTTSLQHRLAAATAPLAERGVLYPRTGRPRRGPRAGHHQLAWSILGKGRPVPTEVWSDLGREWARSGLPRMVLSAEGFEHLSPTGIRQLRDQLPDARFRVVVYLRRPCAFLRSVYLQRLKKGNEHRPFAEFVQHNAHRCDYPRLLADWATVFGKAALVPRSYDKAAQGVGVIDDFLSLLDIDAVALPDSAGMPQRRNRTPSEGMLRCLYALNRAPVRPLLRPPSKAGLHALRRALVLLDRVDGGRTGGLLGARLPPVIDRAGLALAQRVCIDRIDALFNDWLSAEDRPWFEPSTAGPKRRDQD